MFRDQELHDKLDGLNLDIKELREILIRLIHDNQQTKVRVKNIKKNLK